MKIKIDTYVLSYNEELDAYEYESDKFDLTVFQDFLDEYGFEEAEEIVITCLDNKHEIIADYAVYRFNLLGLGMTDSLTLPSQQKIDLSEFKKRCKLLSLSLDATGLDFEISNDGILADEVEMYDMDLGECEHKIMKLND